MMNYLYKQLSESDIPLLKQLLKVFGEAFNEIEAYQNHIPSDQYLANLLSKDTFIALVALDKEKVVGGLCAYVLEKFEQERKEIYIYDLAVSENFRKQGIATGLIEKLKEIARKQGAWVIYVQADKNPEDEPARKLYEKLGTKEDVFHYDIDPNKL